MVETAAGVIHKIRHGESLHPVRFARTRAEDLRLRWRKRVHRMMEKPSQPVPVFVLGNQRSGTTMILNHLNRHLGVDVYHEDSKLMQDWLMKDVGTIRRAMRSSRAKAVVLKPLEDSHRVQEFLDTFEEARVIWAFRDYRDVINSSLKHDWGVQLKTYVTKIVEGETFRYSAPLNLTDKNRRLVRRYYTPTIHENDCVALIWYLRNTIFFDKELAGRSDVLLVRYENLTLQPEVEFGKIASFIGIEIAEGLLEGIHSRSIQKHPEPELNPRIKRLCDRMLSDLNDVHVGPVSDRRGDRVGAKDDRMMEAA